MEFVYNHFPNLERSADQLLQSLVQTLQMVFGSGVISFCLGIFFGVCLVVMRRGGILQNIILYTVLEKTINVIRSVPFLILIIILIPLTRLIMGTTIGVQGAIVPLVIGTAPFFSRQVETAISEVDDGLVEASVAMGMSPLMIIWRVYLRESIPALARVTQITTINLISLVTLAGAVGAGGLGDFAIRFGHMHGMRDLMWITIAIILVMVSIVQGLGNIVIKKTTR
ncbi:MAG: ABC transporter permease subunit [Defluviitaleaceae bacterium]|nr:ABC transporter permease subunit [Defluviitaleaceae bacterium]